MRSRLYNPHVQPERELAIELFRPYLFADEIGLSLS